MKAIFVVALTALLVAFASTSPECGSGQHDIFLPNPDDCSTFYQCDRGEPLLMQCNEGLEFNPKLKVCDWPRKTVRCKRLVRSSPSDSPASAATVTGSPDVAPEEVTVHVQNDTDLNNMQS
ncbi:peritrophin-1 isoform X1 [Bombus impatiens]|uniref:Peritrophin-1 isoform X1 n=1 Tax=Bombus impatiens TaxID=132113 RepID=A0A6P3V1R3_BOMIM|nr:peritrophin-1 isoform X1 [Bombus impatiens]